MNIHAKKVETTSDIKDFLNFTWEQPYQRFDIPILHNVIKSMLDGTHPSCKYGELTGWLLFKDDEVVGRTTLHTNSLFNEKLDSKTLLFGCTIVKNDSQVFDALFKLIDEQAQLMKATQVFGPASLLPNQQGGATISNFDTPGFVDSAYTPQFFVEKFSEAGYRNVNQAQTWICDNIQNSNFKPTSLFKFDDARFERENLKLRFGNRKSFENQRSILLPLINKSFSTLPYFTEIDGNEFKFQTEGLEYLIDESLLIYLEKDEVPVAFVLVVPDISEFLIKCSGNLNFINQVKLYFSRKKYRQDAVLIIKGTDPECAGMGYQTLLHRELFKNLKSGGYIALRSTFVEHSNPGSSASYIRAGGRPIHDFAFFSKEVGIKQS